MAQSYWGVASISTQKHYHLWRIKTCGGCDADICAGIYAKKDDAAHKYPSQAHRQARSEGLAKGEFFTRACDCLCADCAEINDVEVSYAE